MRALVFRPEVGVLVEPPSMRNEQQRSSWSPRCRRPRLPCPGLHAHPLVGPCSLCKLPEEPIPLHAIVPHPAILLLQVDWSVHRMPDSTPLSWPATGCSIVSGITLTSAFLAPSAENDGVTERLVLDCDS